MCELIIIRGAPGSGKTTLAKNDYIDYCLVEADQYFMTDGMYKFDHTRIKEAHIWCQNKVKDNLSKGIKTVVANTFTKKWELEFYLNLTNDFKVIHLVTMYGNIHGVPEEIVKRMIDNYEPMRGKQNV